MYSAPAMCFCVKRLKRHFNLVITLLNSLSAACPCSGVRPSYIIRKQTSTTNGKRFTWHAFGTIRNVKISHWQNPIAGWVAMPKKQRWAPVARRQCFVFISRVHIRGDQMENNSGGVQPVRGPSQRRSIRQVSPGLANGWTDGKRRNGCPNQVCPRSSCPRRVSSDGIG